MSKTKVLLADDNLAVLRILQSVLESLGCEVMTASDGADALLKAREWQPRMVVSDFSMPIMDGVQLYRKLQEYPEHRDVPFVLLAARTEIERRIKNEQLAPDERIEKPFFATEVRQRLKSLLSRLQHHRLETMPVEDGTVQGRLADMSPVDLIQALEIGRKSGELRLEREGQSAILFLREGQIYDAQCGDLQGEAVVYQVLTWADGEFRIRFGAESKQVTVKTSTQGLLMEGMRKLDESELGR